MASKRSVTNADTIIGERIKSQRLRLKMTQQSMGELLGITFQQVQKYENGANRVSAARLVEIADAMKVEVGYFIADLGNAKARRDSGDDAAAEYVASKEGIQVAKAMLAIKSDAVRQSIVELLKILAVEPEQRS